MNNYNQYDRGGAMSPYKKSVPKYRVGGNVSGYLPIDPTYGGPTIPPELQLQNPNTQQQVVEETPRSYMNPLINNPANYLTQVSGISNWWKDRLRLMGIMEQRGRKGARSVIDIRGAVKEGASPGGAYEDLLVEEENPLIAKGSPYLYKNVMGFQEGGRLNRGNATVTGEEFKSFNKSMAQIGLGIINSFGGNRARGRFIDGGKF